MKILSKTQLSEYDQFRKWVDVLNINYNLISVLKNQLIELEKEFSSTQDEMKRRRIFLEIERTYRKMDLAQTKS
jgi:hypothetical protein